MSVLARGLSWVDLEHLGHPQVIATAVIGGSGALALIDPGPSTCLPALDMGLQRQGFRLSSVTHILLTHIHLDHAGATGTIVRRHPDVTVLVHERGAPHLIDPVRLIASATRLYGDQMERLWGEIAPVPARNVSMLTGGERIDVAGRPFEVALTPGHAAHHLCFYDASSGIAFVGDTAGVCIGGGYVFPPTNPPEVDLEGWRGSIDRIEAWGADALFLTHFGPTQAVRTHLRTLADNLETTASLVRTLLMQPGTDDDRRRRFEEQVTRELRHQMSEAQIAAYARAEPLELAWLGLARYWRKRGVGAEA